MQRLVTVIRYLLVGVLCATGALTLLTWWWVEKTKAAPERVVEAAAPSVSREAARELREMKAWAAKLAEVERRNKTLMAEVERLEGVIAAMDARQGEIRAASLMVTEAREAVQVAARTDEGLQREALRILGPLGVTQVTVRGGR